ncbi:MAG: alpha-amylase family glycosyl hydrolase [Pseudomonadota bacterium]
MRLTFLLVALIINTIARGDDVLAELPFGDIRPQGWVERQMRHDLEHGFVGKLDQLVPDLIVADDIYGEDRLTKLVKDKDVGTHNSGAEWEVQFLWWNSETQSNWWDGYLRHALLLADPAHRQRVDEYVANKLATADEDGYIGIYAADLRYDHTTENGELWAQASLFRGLLAYYETTQKQAVLDAVIRAVELTMRAYPIDDSTPFKTSNAFAGVGHGLTFVDVLNTLYRLTGDRRYLNYAVFLYEDYSRHPQPEEDVQLDNLLDADYRFKGHGVHTYEHLRALTLAATHDDDTRLDQALVNYLQRLDAVTTASGGPIGDEWITGRHAHHGDTGYEYCSLQELLHSYAVLLQNTGDPGWADRMEWLTFNAAQGARHPDGQSIAYCKTDNSVEMLGHLDMGNPQGEMRYKYSPAHQDVAVCCVPNAGRLYPTYVQNMLQRHDDGLVVSLYGPSVVTTEIDGVDVSVRQITNYPFEHTVRFVVETARAVKFELRLRQPGWTESVALNGIDAEQGDGYLRVDQRWTGRTEFTLTFDDAPEVTHGDNGTAFVEDGPLLYALQLEHAERTGREYAPGGFVDRLFEGVDPEAERYQLSLDSRFERSAIPEAPSWATPPTLRGALYDPVADRDVDVALVPMGSTILRKVSFDVADNDEDLLLHVPSPDWRDQVIYFLMTDRFNDGNPDNNDQGVGEYNPSLESHYSGGDIQGVIDQLDYIQGLGATAVWTTPIVANQWWSSHTEYSGYHGYWATDFGEVDPHVGTLEDYQRLSDQLHRRGMYLIKDIVVNHTGNFFNYRGGQDGYDAEDTAKNFMWLEPEDALQRAPTQPPFDRIDRNNPEHVKSDIYHWTPSITDYRNKEHQFIYQLASLADINTSNPLVIDAFKRIYGDWIRTAGVDAFRIDTVRYVDHGFFHHFMHDEDGIHASAQNTGRDHFLAFGEVFDTSKPHQNDGEHRVASYLGSEARPELNSIISFPLHHDFKTVFAQGFPTEHLAYRIRQHMTVYDDPYVVPTFIDNHDMERFLASGDRDGLHQALAALLTLPGVPVIYQGTEQAMTASREAMFEGGYGADHDRFDRNGPLYDVIRELIGLRTSDPLFTRGDLNILASNRNGPGLLAYSRGYEGRQVVVLFNTASHPVLANDVRVADQGAKLEVLYVNAGKPPVMRLDNNGRLTTELSGRRVLIAEVVYDDASSDVQHPPTIETQVEGQTVVDDLRLSGRAAPDGGRLLLVRNARLQDAIEVPVSSDGAWSHVWPIRNLGRERVSLVAYQPEMGSASAPLTFESRVDAATHAQTVIDPANDDTGPTGNHSPPQHEQSVGQQDILSVDARIGGEILELKLTMRALSDDWIPPNGFDNVALSLFFDASRDDGASELPLLNARMPSDWRWDMGHVIYGWGNTTFSNEGADSARQGKRFGIAPTATVDKTQRTITLRYRASDFGFDDWLATNVFVTTWDITGEGVYRELAPAASDWHFGGGPPEGEKILDSIALSLGPE